MWLLGWRFSLSSIAVWSFVMYISWRSGEAAIPMRKDTTYSDTRLGGAMKRGPLGEQIRVVTAVQGSINIDHQQIGDFKNTWSQNLKSASPDFANRNSSAKYREEQE
jgi:hypothetical protein